MIFDTLMQNVVVIVVLFLFATAVAYAADRLDYRGPPTHFWTLAVWECQRWLIVAAVAGVFYFLGCIVWLLLIGV